VGGGASFGPFVRCCLPGVTPVREQSGRWDTASQKKPRSRTWPPSMNAADLPPVIKGHKPICNPTTGACQGESCQDRVGDERERAGFQWLDVRAASPRRPTRLG
jgi:hypothetical protein